jgi:2-iminobutanoate/2-iminopropanoate deaminase
MYSTITTTSRSSQARCPNVTERAIEFREARVTEELSRINATGLRPPAGAYVHAVVHRGMVYCSGQIGVDPATGDVPVGVGPQTRQALNNLAAVLANAGSDLGKVVKASVFLRDASMFGDMDAAFSEAFGSAKPSRTTVPGLRFGDGTDVEIDVIAAL